MTYTIIIIAVTALISLAGFNNETIINKLILWPRLMHKPEEYYRFLTSGFIHADMMHLFFNMFTLYAFGQSVEAILLMYVGHSEVFLLLYLTGIIIASIPSFLKNRNNSYYRSLGASGGVATVLFFTIYYAPWSSLRIFPIPVNIPCIVFGALYLAYEVYMSKRGLGNVNHDAHIWGSVYGLIFALFIDPTHGRAFIETIMHPH
jgi:membrane associated rhomboid family serine protease